MACGPRSSAPVIWIEETGCWFAGPDGKPARAQGIVRVNNERHARDEQLMRLSRHDPLTGELNRTPSRRLAGGSDRRGRAFPVVLLLHADRHRSFGARQRRLRLRRRGRRDRRSRQTHPRQAARRRRARPILRQQVRADFKEQHGRRHQYRGRAFPGRDPRRGDPDQIRPRLGDGLDRRDQHPALRPQCR